MMANPRGLRASSGYSRPTVTVEKRMKMGVFSPTLERKLAFYHMLRLSDQVILSEDIR